MAGVRGLGGCGSSERGLGGMAAVRGLGGMAGVRGLGGMAAVREG